MTKDEFLRQLMWYIAALPPEEQRRAADYYQELILDGMESGRSEEEVVADLGSPEEAGRRILEEYGGSPEFSAPLPEKRRSPAMWVLLGLVGFFGVIIGLPLLLAAFVVYLAGWIVLLSLAISGVACIAGGLVSGAGMVFSLTSHPAAALFQLGGGLLATGLGVLLTLGAVLLTVLYGRFSRWMFRRRSRPPMAPAEPAAVNPRRRGAKWSLVLGGILCAAGVVVCGVGFTAAGFDWMAAVSTESYRTHTVTVSTGDLQTLRVKARNQSVSLRPTSENDIQITYTEYESDDYATDYENGVFTLSQWKEDHWYDSIRRGMFGGFAQLNRKIVVEIPASCTAELDIETSNASLTAEDLPPTAVARFQSSNGSLTLRRLQIAQLTAATSNASVRLESVTGGQMAVASSSGSLTLRDLHLTGSLTASTTNASLTAERLQAAGAELRTSNGSLRITDAVLSGSLTAHTSNGSVRVERLGAPDIRLESSNGSIRGSLLGREEEFSIVTRTFNGSAAPVTTLRPQAGKQLEAVTSNASIRLEFEE